MSTITETFTQVDNTEEELFGFDLIDAKMPFEVADPDEIADFFYKYKLVPYAGSRQGTGDSLLQFFDKMADVTPTSQACIESKKITAFGGKIKVCESFDNQFDLGDEYNYVEGKKAQDYAKFIREEIDWYRDETIKDSAINNYVEWEKNGNMFLEVNMWEVGTERKVRFIRHETRMIKFQWSNNYNDRIAVHSNKWGLIGIFPDDAREIPVYPNAIKDKGVYKTIICSKNGNIWYGKPPSKGSFLNQYNEYQNLFYLCRLTGKDFTGKLIIEVEDDAPNVNRLINNKAAKNAGFGGTLDRWERKFTNKSKDPSTLILMSRPKDSKPMVVEQLLPNTNEKYYKTIGTMNKDNIIQSHSWSPRLLGGNTSSYFSTGVYIDELKVKDVTTNLYYQNKVRDLLDTAIKLAIKWKDRSDIDGLSFQFQSPYIQILKNEKYTTDTFGSNEVGAGTTEL